MEHEIKGHIIIVMAPMASGKGILISHIIKRFPMMKRLVSCTTRTRRPGEKEGEDYFFLSRDEFERKMKAHEFIEWSEFSGNLYGTLKTEILGHLQEGHVAINEMDLRGVRQLFTLLPRDRMTVIYIDAGDWEALKARALLRAPISEDELALRRLHYHEEIEFRDEADFIISNNDHELEGAKAHIEKIVGTIIKNSQT